MNQKCVIQVEIRSETVVSERQPTSLKISHIKCRLGSSFSAVNMVGSIQIQRSSTIYVVFILLRFTLHTFHVLKKI